MSSENKEPQPAEESSLSSSLLVSHALTRGGGPLVLPELQDSLSATPASTSPPTGAPGDLAVALSSMAVVELEDGAGPWATALTCVVMGA